MNDHVWHYDVGEPQEVGISEEHYDSYYCRSDAIDEALREGLQTFTLFTTRRPTDEDIEEHIDAVLHSVADEDTTDSIRESMAGTFWWSNWEEPLEDSFDFSFLDSIHAAIRPIVIKALRQGFALPTGYSEVVHSCDIKEEDSSR